MASMTVGSIEASILRRLDDEDDQSQESESTEQNLINEITGELYEFEEGSEQEDDSEETLAGSSEIRDMDSESDSEDSSSSSDWHGGHHHDKFGEGQMLSHHEHDHDGERIGKAAVAGFVSIAFIALVGLAIRCFFRRRRRQRAARSIKNAGSKSEPESNSSQDVAGAGVWVVAGAPLPEGYAYAKPPPELEGAMPGQMYALPEPATVATGGMAPDVAVGIPVEDGKTTKVCVEGLVSGSSSSGKVAGENTSVACGV